MKFTFTNGFKECYYAYLALQVSTFSSIVMASIFPLFGLLMLFLAVAVYNRAPTLSEIVVIILALGFSPIIGAIAVYQGLRKNKAATVPHTYEFTDAGIGIVSSLSTAHVQWGAICRLRETRWQFLFYISPRMAYCLPKSAIGDVEQVSQFRAFLNTLEPVKKLGTLQGG